jgi:hypothetical protein
MGKSLLPKLHLWDNYRPHAHSPLPPPCRDAAHGSPRVQTQNGLERCCSRRKYLATRCLSQIHRSRHRRGHTRRRTRLNPVRPRCRAARRTRRRTPPAHRRRLPRPARPRPPLLQAWLSSRPAGSPASAEMAPHVRIAKTSCKPHNTGPHSFSLLHVFCILVIAFTFSVVVLIGIRIRCWRLPNFYLQRGQHVDVHYRR